MFISDRDALEKELEELNLFISKNTEWTPIISDAYIRRRKVEDQIKSLGKKDWF